MTGKSDEKYILMTGANGGLGAELAEYFLAAGNNNILFHFHNSNEKILAVLKKCDLSSDHCFPADLTNENDVMNMKKEIEDKFGAVYGLINLAGGSSNAISWKLSVEEFQKIININLTSAFVCSKVFIPKMREMSNGRIINISSVVAYTGIIGAVHYAAAKSGIIGLTKSLALELAENNVTVNAVALGYFNYGLINQVSKELQEKIKEKIPMKRFGNIDEIGSIIKYLLSEESKYTTGQMLHVNGGLY